MPADFSAHADIIELLLFDNLTVISGSQCSKIQLHHTHNHNLSCGLLVCLIQSQFGYNYKLSLFFGYNIRKLVDIIPSEFHALF